MESRKEKIKGLDMGSMVYGKVPPQAKDIEVSVLGSILMESRTFDIVAEILSKECFYVEQHQRIFEAMQTMAIRREQIEILTLVEHLKKTEELDLVGGPYYITKLTNSVTSTANIEMYCRILLQKFMLREMIRIGGTMVTSAYEDTADAFDEINSAEKSMLELSNKINITDYFSLDRELVKIVDELYTLKDSDITLSGISSGFTEIDAITHGWQPTDLIIVAARPSVGKTAFALNVLRNAAFSGEKKMAVGIFSLEMSGNQLAKRLLAAESEVFLNKIITGKLGTGEDWQNRMDKIYNDGVMTLSGVKVYIDDSAGINMFHIRSKARKMVRKHGVKLIVIDYLQLIHATNKKTIREQQISEISGDLKGLAKELKVPIIALSQLSREVEKRGENEPRLSDIREGGSIEQDADIVIFLWKPSDVDIQNNAAEKYVRYYSFAKHRNGELDKSVLAWYPEIQKMKNKDDPAPNYVTGSTFRILPKDEPKQDLIPDEDDLPF